MCLGDALYYEGKTAEAMQALDRATALSGADEEPVIISGIVRASLGERDRIDRRILRWKPEEVVDGDLAEWVGAIYAVLGEKETALAWLHQAVRLGNHNYPWFQHDKNWDGLRGDPEFQRIMAEVAGHWNSYRTLFQ